MKPLRLRQKIFYIYKNSDGIENVNATIIVSKNTYEALEMSKATIKRIVYNLTFNHDLCGSQWFRTEEEAQKYLEAK